MWLSLSLVTEATLVTCIRSANSYRSIPNVAGCPTGQFDKFFFLVRSDPSPKDLRLGRFTSHWRSVPLHAQIPPVPKSSVPVVILRIVLGFSSQVRPTRL